MTAPTRLPSRSPTADSGSGGSPAHRRLAVRDNGPVSRLRENKETLLFATSTALILLGGVAWLAKAETPADVLWTIGTVLGLAFSAVTTAAAVIRRRPSVDIIAVLALAGAIAVGEPFAGAMITVMLASGQLLEARAAARARRHAPPGADRSRASP